MLPINTSFITMIYHVKKGKIKALLLIILICFYGNVTAQKKVDGLLSINQYYGKVVSAFDGNYFWAKHNSKYNIYDKTGELIKQGITIKNQIDVRDYQNSFNIKDGIFVEYDKAKTSKKFRSFSNQKQVSDHLYSTIISYDNGTYFAVRELDQLKGKKAEYLYLDNNLNTIYKIKPEYISAIKKSRIRTLNSEEYYRRIFGSVNDGLIKHYNTATQKFGFINTNGKLVIPNKYVAVGDFSEGLAFFQNEDKLYGFINTKGDIAIPAKYSKQPYSFFSNRARVLSKSGHWGFIDNNDQLVIDAKYKYATNFYKNHALVRENQFSPILLINISGEIVQEFNKDLKINFQEQANIHQKLGLKAEYFTHINPILKQLIDFKKGIFIHKNNKSGLVDINGNIVLDFIYKSLKDYNNNFLLAIMVDKSFKEKHALINDKGDIVVEVGLSKF